MLCGAGWVDVGDLGQFLGLLLAVGDERPVDEDAVDHAELRGAGGAEGEPDGPAALFDVRLAHQVLGGRVGRVVDAGDRVALVDAALVGGVRRHRAVPVEVVRRQVEDGGGVGARGGRPVQLVAGEFDGEDVVLGLAEHRVQQRYADVADGRGAQARRLQDRGQHPYGRGLAVGAGDREPGRGLASVVAAQAPGQFDVAPDRDARLGGSQEERLVRLPAGGGDDEFRGRRQGRAVAEAHGDAERLQFSRLRAGALVVAVVDDGDERAALVQGAGRGNPADAEPGDGDVLALPVHGAAHFLAAHPA